MITVEVFFFFNIYIFNCSDRRCCDTRLIRFRREVYNILSAAETHCDDRSLLSYNKNNNNLLVYYASVLKWKL